MVSFQCEGCCDTVKKPKLDAHYARCHAPVSCIDCSKTFRSPAEFKGHTSCMTEAEKHEKSLYKGPRSEPNLSQPNGTNGTNGSSAATDTAPSINPDRASQIENGQVNNNKGFKNNGNGYNGGRQQFHGRQQPVQQRGGSYSNGRAPPFNNGSPNFIKLVNERTFGSKPTSPVASPPPTTPTAPEPSSAAANADATAASTSKADSKKISKAERKRLKAEKKAEKAASTAPNAASPSLSDSVPAESGVKKSKKRKHGADEAEAVTTTTPGSATVSAEEPLPKKKKSKEGKLVHFVDGLVVTLNADKNETSIREKGKKEKKAKPSNSTADEDAHGDVTMADASTSQTPVGSTPVVSNGIAADDSSKIKKEKKKKRKDDLSSADIAAHADVEMANASTSLLVSAPAVPHTSAPDDGAGIKKEKKQKKNKHSTSVNADAHEDAKIVGASTPQSQLDPAPAAPNNTTPDNHVKITKEKMEKKEKKSKLSGSATTDAQGVKMTDASAPQSLPDSAPGIPKDTICDDTSNITKEKKKRKSGVNAESHAGVVPTEAAKPLEEAVNGASSEKEKKSKKSRKSIAEDAQKNDVPSNTSVPVDGEKKSKKEKGDKKLKEKKSKDDITAEA